MRRCLPPALANRFVGDPVDVVTGALMDVQVDFLLPGPVPLVWQRHYDSGRCRRGFSLGWGHSHEYECSLRFDLDGIRYSMARDSTVGFPLLDRDGARSSLGPYTLKRVSPRRYLVLRQGAPAREFAFQDGQSQAPLTALMRGAMRAQFHYGRHGLLEAITDAMGRHVGVRCEEGTGRILRLFFPESGGRDHRIIVEYSYDMGGNLVGGRDAYGNRFSFAFDSLNRMIRKTDRSGYSFHFSYDSMGRCASAGGEDGVLRVDLRYEEGRTVVTREDGGEWTYLFGPDGAVTDIVDPYGGVRHFEMDPDGRTVQEVDSNGNSLFWVYDAAGRLLGKTTPEGRFLPVGVPESAFRRPAHELAASPVEYQFGRLILRESIRLPWRGSPMLDLIPQDLHALVWTTDARASEAKTTPSALPSQVDPSTGVRLVYGEFGSLVREEHPDGTTRRWSYDANGNVSGLVDRNGARHRFEYGSWNHLVRRIDPLGSATTFEYSHNEKLTSVTDPGGTRTEFVYDMKDRPGEVLRHGKTRDRYHYDLADNLVKKEDGDGNVLLQQEFGPGNRVSVKTWASGEVHRFEYDDAGRYARLEWSGESVVFAYDEQGRRVAERRSGSGIEHEFDGPELRSTTVLDRFVISYSRDPGGALLVRDPSGSMHRVHDLGYGLVLRSTPSGREELSQYTREGRCLLKAVWNKRSLGSASVRRYTYSPEGTLVQVDHGYGRTTQYTYDGARRLVSVGLSDGQTEVFEYDLAGNLTRKPRSTRAEVTAGNMIGRLDGWPVWYDERDHMAEVTQEGVTNRFEYDARGFLVRCHLRDGTWEADYDPLGRMTRTRGPGGSVEYVWDTDRVAAEIRDGARLRIYVYPDPLALCPLAFVDHESRDAAPSEGRSYAVFADHLATPIRIEDAHGSPVWEAAIEPYGRAEVTKGNRTLDFRLRFPGHHYNPETDLHYNRFRHYSPTLGRYLQSDPIGVSGGVNLYSYTSRPLDTVDLRGLRCENHPAEHNPNCEDCEDNEVTQIWEPPRPPDPDLLARIGPPSEVFTGHPLFHDPRPREIPYRNPPEMYRVRPGRPLDVDRLDTSQTYLWVVDSDGGILVAPERQEGFGRVVKHGDLTPGEDGQRRGAARAGGELNYNPDQGEWVMDNESSYTFVRTDGHLTDGDSLDASHDLLGQSGTDTSDIVTANNSGEDKYSSWSKRR